MPVPSDCADPSGQGYWSACSCRRCEARSAWLSWERTRCLAGRGDCPEVGWARSDPWGIYMGRLCDAHADARLAEMNPEYLHSGPDVGEGSDDAGWPGELAGPGEVE